MIGFTPLLFNSGRIRQALRLAPLCALSFLLLSPSPASARWINIPNAVLANPATKIELGMIGGGKFNVLGAALAPPPAPAAGAAAAPLPPVMLAPPAAGAATAPVAAGAIAGVTPLTAANAAALGVPPPVLPAAAGVPAAGGAAAAFTPLTWLQNIDPVVSAKLFAVGFGLVVASAGLARSIGLLFSMFKG